MSEQNFHDFHLIDLSPEADLDDVYTMADGLIPEVAERLDVSLGAEPNSEDLGALVGKIGKNKVLRDNDEVMAIDRETAAGFVERSGVQEALDRSLWTPEFSAVNLDVVVVTGAVANWQDRAVKIVQEKVDESTTVMVATGGRVMDTGTEKVNANVVSFFEEHGRYPTETEYAAEFVVRPLRLTHGVGFKGDGYGTAKGDEIMSKLLNDNPQFFDQRLGVARVANAGIQLAVQMRAAAIEIEPDFDDNPEDPQVFILTDTFPVARNEEQEGQPQSYQKAITALRQVALTAKMLHEAAGGE